MVCIKTVSYSFIHNKPVFGEVNPQRGVRQRDPISPYIYILCAEGLSAIIRRNEEVGLIYCVSIARGAPNISHLLFADDCYFFFRATLAKAGVMRNILDRYETISGQAINMNKSSLYFSPNTMESTRREVCECLSVREVQEPGRNLGMPMTIGRMRTSVFHFLTDRIK